MHVKNVALVADRGTRCKQTGRRQSYGEEIRQSSKQKMYFSDNSDEYVTTASQDERIDENLRQEKEKEKSEQDLLESQRKEVFEEAFQEKIHEIFQLPGLTFLKFTHVKIKFCFEPCKVVTLVKKDVKFYCSLGYNKKFKFWSVRRDSFPVNYKLRIYNIFYGGPFSVTDETVQDAIYRTYIKLELWAKEEETYRQQKFLKYQNDEDVELDSDDEELFLTEDERKELQAKRERVLKRMVIPTDPKLLVLPPERPRKKRKRKKRQHSASPERAPPLKAMRRPRRVTMTDSE
ncbi:uncharacterized protein LOC108908229 isoform X2 [Anoplophora glabripennis]|uniref:uncharacterized protein LOC108908229 isoform X2 n=1 Tax=Anoplophora glabripennis TaxID=217634 RepID=UPI000874DBF6|nr:uncharacterized protein LOC108908229 isoform X2 [Anoplophora glabripennis]